MKHFLLLALIATLAILPANAQRWDNYRPDNTSVKLRETNLPIVFINVDGNMIDREERITAHMKIIYNGPGELNYADTITYPNQTINYDGYIALRYRGNSSFTLSDKKPYSFRPIDKPLEEGGSKVKVKLLDLPKDNNWAFLAPYSDRSMMRDLLAFELSRPWMDYTPRGRYCEIILDGIYYGVYILTEVVSKGKNRLNLDDPGAEGDELTGGYLLEVDRTDEVTYTSKYHPVNSSGRAFSRQYIHIQYKEPEYEELTQAQISYIQGSIDAMEDALAASNYTDPVNGYAKYLDPTSFADYQLAEEFAHNVDGYRLSAKFFKWRDSVDPRFKMVLWDLNLAYGNSDYYQGWRTDTWMYQSNATLNSAGDTQLVPFWWYKINTDPAYTALLKSRWAQYRRSNFREDRIMALIDSLSNTLTSSDAVTRNSRAWPRWGIYVWPNYHVSTSYDDEISYLKGWIHDRLAWMDSQLGFDSSLLLGDVNLDGNVDVIDVSMLIDMVLDNPVNQEIGETDINGDGMVDVIDVSALIDIILDK